MSADNVTRFEVDEELASSGEEEGGLYRRGETGTVKCDPGEE